MPGWIIQGVRGEGKSLCAVGKAKEYLSRGRPVATNLDLFLEHLVEPHNPTLVYRLPDHPRSVDFDMLPPAYDPKYKPEDRNGLLILDESILWLNSRDFSDKDRKKVLAWLILSRKAHWDLILLAQDHEAIDKTARSALCDYLVQASRSDRGRSSIFTKIHHAIKFQEIEPTVHRYDVFYGFSFADKPKETWEFTGKDFYDAYDTNQQFKDGNEILGSELVDMRATYTMLPASYLSKFHYLEPLRKKLESIKQIKFTNPPEPDFDKIEEGVAMSVKRVAKNDNTSIKMILLIIVGVSFVGYRVYAGNPLSTDILESSAVVESIENEPDDFFEPVLSESQPVKRQVLVNVTTEHFADILVTKYRPRLAGYLYNSEKGSYGLIEFYDGDTLVNKFSISELQSTGVAVVHRKYGVDIITAKAEYPVTAWPKPSNSQKF